MPNTLVDELEGVLKGPRPEGLGLIPCATLAELLAVGSGARYLRQPGVSYEDLFKNASFLIHEAGLGTLGIVYDFLEFDEEKLQSNLEEAIYVRHLLVQHAYPANAMALVVEVVLLCSSSEEGRVQGALRNLVSRGELLDAVHAIGISLLSAPEDSSEPFPESRIRRAFPWFLRACAEWYAETGDSHQFKRFQGLELENYRLPGARALEIDDETEIHIIFGANGTGKSSLTEALELVTCGTVERLKNDHLLGAIAFDSSKEARVKLRLGGAKQHRTFTVPAQAPLSGALWEKRPATAFRLDQTVMDKLTHPSNRQERTKVLLSSFFPEASLALENYDRRAQEAERAFSALPTGLTAFSYAENLENRCQEVSMRFAWLDKPREAVPPGRPEDCLPLPLADLGTLATLNKDLEPLLKKWTAEDLTPELLRGLAREIDLVLGRLQGQLAEHLPGALIALGRVADWYEDPGQGEGGDDFVEVLNGWLEHRALADIGKKAVEVARVLAAIERRGALEKVGGLLSFHLPHKQDLTNLENEVRGWVAKEEELFSRALALEKSEAQADGSMQQSIPRPAFSSEDVLSLNKVGEALGAPQLGTQIRQALDRGKAVKVERAGGGDAIDVGRFAGWAKGLVNELEELTGPAERLRGLVSERAEDDVPQLSAQRIRRFEEALAKARVLDQEAQNLATVFYGKIIHNRKLANALNELLALFTPARWAYQDVDLAYAAAAAGASELSFKSGSSNIDVRLNSAELNLFTVALFLLCAPKLPNPLHLLVLDDPLQNMDELTVTTFARGFARLLRLPTWPKDWQFLVLLHGEDDLERLRQEIPAAVYRLHWQSPLEAKTLPVIRKEDRESTHNSELQKLEQVLGTG